MQIRILAHRRPTHPGPAAGPFAAELQEQCRRAALMRDMPAGMTPPTVVDALLVDEWQGAAQGAWS